MMGDEKVVDLDDRMEQALEEGGSKTSDVPARS
jgi:hypothetical protein